LEFDIKTCFLKILVNSIGFLNDEDADDDKTERGPCFCLTFTEFDNISTGLCYTIDLNESKYCLEPLSILSGIHYIVSSPELRSKFLFYLLGAMLEKDTTEHNRSSYFDLFVSIKVAFGALFRKRLFEFVVETEIRDGRTKWISNVVFPERDYLKMKLKISDDEFVESLDLDSDDVVVPYDSAGPNLKWRIFLFGLKINWTKSQIRADESNKNEEKVTPNLCFARDEIRKSEHLKKKRMILHQICSEVAQRKIEESRGFIRVWIEFLSPVSCPTLTVNPPKTYIWTLIGKFSALCFRKMKPCVLKRIFSNKNLFN
jgi:hypothetical protein